jgi:hypothetical protein
MYILSKNKSYQFAQITNRCVARYAKTEVPFMMYNQNNNNKGVKAKMRDEIYAKTEDLNLL